MYLLLTFDKNLMTNDQWQMILFLHADLSFKF